LFNSWQLLEVFFFQEMWQEFNALLALQQERVDSIEDNVAKTHKKVKHATQMLVEAEKDQQCARKVFTYFALFL
jgi:t-SNARE complex subunit (syntaxin)